MYVSIGGYITDEQADLIEKEGIHHKQMIIHTLNADTHQWLTIPSQDYTVTYDLTGILPRSTNTVIQWNLGTKK